MQCVETFAILCPQIEIKLKKPEAVRWEQLEGDGVSPKLKNFTPGVCIDKSCCFVNPCLTWSLLGSRS